MYRTQVSPLKLQAWRLFIVAVGLAVSATPATGQERISWSDPHPIDSRATLQEQADKVIQSAGLTDRMLISGVAWATIGGAISYFLWDKESMFSRIQFVAIGAGGGLITGLVYGHETGERNRDRRPRWREVGDDIWSDMKLYTKPDGMYIGEVVCDETASDGTGLVRIRLSSGETTSTLRTTVSKWYVESRDPALEAARWCSS